MTSKTTKTPKPAATPAKADAPAFKFDNDLAIPPKTRGGTVSDFAQKLQAMPVGASFLEPVNVPENIKEPAEREKSFREGARLLSNRLTGAIRRFTKKNPEGFKFETRTVSDDQLGHGVRIWRVEA